MRLTTMPLRYTLAVIAVVAVFCMKGYAQSTPFPASHELLQKFNEQAAREGLVRIWEADLDGMKSSGLLVPLPNNVHATADTRLEKRFRYVMPWTVEFLHNFGKALLQNRKRTLQVNSAVRTVEYQRELKEGRLVKRGKRWIRVGRNANAADYEGSEASSHLYGSTIDIAKLQLDKRSGKRVSLPLSDISWMRAYLKPLRDTGCIEVIEEFNQAVFHIMVFKDYRNCSASLYAKTGS